MDLVVCMFSMDIFFLLIFKLLLYWLFIRRKTGLSTCRTELWWITFRNLMGSLVFYVFYMIFREVTCHGHGNCKASQI